MAQTLADMLQQMLNLGLAEEELGHVRLTLLGRACGKSTLGFSSAMRLVELVRGIGPLSFIPLLLISLLQALPELDRLYTPFFTKSPGREAAWPQRVAGIFGVEVMHALQRFAKDNNCCLARCKRTCALYDWVHGVSVEEIQRTFTTNPYAAPFNYGDVRSIANRARFHLRSAREIVALLLASTPAFEEEVDDLLSQLANRHTSGRAGSLEASYRASSRGLPCSACRSCDDTRPVMANVTRATSRPTRRGHG